MSARNVCLDTIHFLNPLFLFRDGCEKIKMPDVVNDRQPWMSRRKAIMFSFFIGTVVGVCIYITISTMDRSYKQEEDEKAFKLFENENLENLCEIDAWPWKLPCPPSHRLFNRTINYKI